MTSLVPSEIDPPHMAPLEPVHPNMSHSYSNQVRFFEKKNNGRSVESLLTEVVDTLREQKQLTVQMDSTVVGSLVEPHITNAQERKSMRKNRFYT